ncbi:hypothetical protein BO94DRAFT_563431 [Aspergillus sclerotioniger CBS 115572]|uniref:NAD(P)-binding domain-containing protein n=1 Tax=Aspergillus sclerotioniger CBS 115572 TaxID=1450535 RepID=A0A317X5M1_9EURO|nr:hypothetical protein BO94DRAFT_563431 [Aspergillus sclerotioniger CBS 115572]PWY93869.1 hypothetical protein BO94DRAFT_563431 [Aspergillus sclerotioniger CBS 115572]
MTTAAVFGCTGAFPSIKTISRRLPKLQSSKLQALEESDVSKLAGMVASLSPKPSLVFNAVGTTRAAAGGIQNQWKIDHDSCIENARAAKDAGVKTYVIISSAGTRGVFSGYVPCSKMKVGVEDSIKELNFENSIILRPGMILGSDTPKAPLSESIVGNLDKLGQGVQDLIDQTIIGRAAVAAARMVAEGRALSKYWVVEMADIVKLGKYLEAIMLRLLC